MNVDDASSALSKCDDPAFSVVILRKERGRLMAAPVLGVALDDAGDDVSLLMGDFLEEDADLEQASSVEEIRDALAEIGPDGAHWPIFSAAADDPTLGGSLVGLSIDDEVEIFAFLQGPMSDWEE